jgi:hypothetical protein
MSTLALLLLFQGALPGSFAPVARDSIQPLGLTPASLAALSRLQGWTEPDSSTATQDTIVRRKKKAIVSYSGFYSARLTLHRVLSYTMIPLFAASYVTGDQILKHGPEAPAWARKSHAPFATATAALFTVNTITGLWNLWDSRKDPAGRFKRYLHSFLFIAASAGFTYAGTTLATQAENSESKRRLHRTVALSSMGVSVVSWSMMLLFK